VKLFRMPTLSTLRKATQARRVTASVRLIRRGRRPWHVRKLSVFREPGDLVSGRAASPPRRSVSGRRGAVAGDERREKSHSAIVAMKPTNKAGRPAGGAGGAK